jgi:phosphoglycerol transferase MdoB-like AlkP superfamily enzyme
MQPNNRLLTASLVLAVALLLIPKIILIQYFASRWIDTDPASLARYLLQDLLLATALYLIARALLPRYRASFVTLGLLTGTLLLMLLIDMRVRQLWLKPLDWALVQYSLRHAGDLASGAPVFFNQLAGFGLTFRFIVLLMGLAWMASWTLLGVATYRAHHRPYAAPSRASLLGPGVLLIGLLGAAALTQDARYNLNQNIVAGTLVTALRSAGLGGQATPQNLLPFEQPAYSLSRLPDSSRPNPMPGVKNLVYIVMESVRWNSTFGPGVDTVQRYPTLARLAEEGWLSKAYVSVPHSSKGYFSIFTGLHAHPGVEIKEAMPLQQPSVIHALKQQRNMQAVAFSSLFLQFENLDGFLRSIGVDKTYAVADTLSATQGSSFGTNDEHLFLPSIPTLQAIQQSGKGFIALYFPSAAHYPYDCPGSTVPTSELDKYESCIESTDALIGQMLQGFDKAGLLDSTLFVLVGDHGESFGEHGLFIHNSSMHEEEVSVPLIFWAKGTPLPKLQSTLSQQTDIAPTLADFFGLSDAAIEVQGVSLLRPHGKRAFFMSTFFDHLASALVEYPHKYVYEYSSDTLVKYNLAEDPQERDPQTVSGDEFTATKHRLLSYDRYQRDWFEHRPERAE